MPGGTPPGMCRWEPPRVGLSARAGTGNGDGQAVGAAGVGSVRSRDRPSSAVRGRQRGGWEPGPGERPCRSYCRYHSPGSREWCRSRARLRLARERRGPDVGGRRQPEGRAQPRGRPEHGEELPHPVEEIHRLGAAEGDAGDSRLSRPGRRLPRRAHRGVRAQAGDAAGGCRGDRLRPQDRRAG